MQLTRDIVAPVNLVHARFNLYSKEKLQLWLKLGMFTWGFAP